MQRWLIPVLFLLLLITWFFFILLPGQEIIAYADLFPRLAIKDVLGEEFFLWNSLAGSGQASHNICLIFYNLFWTLLNWLLPFWLVQRLVFFIFFLLLFFSQFYFLKTVFKNKNLAILGAIFYVFNFFILLSFLNVIVFWALIFTPFYLALIYKQFTKGLDRKSIVILGLPTLLLSYLAANPPTLLAVFIIIGLFTIFCFLKFSLSSWLKNILLILGLVVFILLINLWWIIPVSQAFVVQAINQAGTFLPSTVTEVETWAWTHARSSFLNIFWLNTGWGWPYNYYYPYAQYYNNPILQVVVFLPLIIAFSSLLFLKKNKPWRPLILFSAVVVLVMFFLGKGLHQPWREVNFWLYQHIPLFWLFREPFGKLLFIIMPLLALLFAFGASNLVDLISRKKRVLQTIFSAVVVLIVLTTVFPLVTGQVILKKQHGQLPGWLVEVPDYWFKMSGYINDQKGDGRILLLPNHDFYMLPYDWGYYGIAIGPELIHSRPLVKLISDEGYIKPSAGYLFLKSQLQQSIDNEDEDKFLQLTKILNIEYILQRNDIDYDLPSRKMFSPEKIRDFLSQVEGVKLERSFGQLDFYKLSGQEDKLVYLTNSYTAVTNEDDWYQSSFTGSNVFLSNCQLPSTSEVSLEKFNYHWQRVNPSRLEVVVDQLTQPAVLVFNESFNPNWVLYIDGVRLSEVKHCLANNYANAWLLDPSEQDLNISLEYQPQKYFWCYFPLSLIVLLGGVVYLLVIKLRKK